MKPLAPSSVHILVVDDDTDIREGTARLLSMAGYVVAKAATGEEALEMVRRAPPDMLILDRDMPGIDGLEVCRRIKAEPALAGILVIMASATYAQSEEQAEGLEAGVDGYIARPIGNREFLARIEAYVRILALTRSLTAQADELKESSEAAREAREASLNLMEDALAARERSEQANEALQKEIAERKQAEARLLRLNRLHIVLSKISETVVRAESRQELYETACRLLVEDGHLRMAFIAEAETSGKYLRKLAGAGEGQALLENTMATLTDEERKRGIIVTALRTGAPDVINDFANDPRMAPWSESVVAAGFRASAAFPIKPGGVTVAALVLCAGELNYFEQDEIRLITAVAGDIAFALEVQEKKAQNLQAQEALRMQAHTLDHIGQAVIATDTQGVIFYANRAASDLYGWPLDEIAGRNVMEVTVPHASREQAEEIMRQLQNGRNWSGEFLVQSRAGRVFPAEVTDSPLLDECGKLIGIVGISSDITDRKQVEGFIRGIERQQRRLAEQLAAERARLLEAQAVAHLGSWDTDIGTMEVTWSPELFRIYEKDPQTFRPDYEGIQKLVHPEDRERIDTAFREALRIPGEYAIEHRLLFPDGRIKHVEERWRTIYNADGKPVRATGVCHDITERHLAEAAVRRADESLRTTLESMTEAFITIDREWRLTYLNAEAERLVQQPREDLLGKNIWEVFPQIIGTAFETHYRRAMADNAAVSFEGNFEELGLWLETRVFPSREGLAIYAKDITELHEQREALLASEREFRTLAESMPQIVWVANEAGQNIYINQNWLDYTGLSLEESMVEGFRAAFHPEDLQGVGAAWKRTLAHGDEFATELRIRAADGSYRWFLNRASPQRDEGRKIVKWFGTCTDIHDLKMADLEISRTNRALKLLSRCHEALIHTDDEAQLLHAVCKIAVNTGSYKMAWVGYPQQDEASSIKPVAICGDDGNYLQKLKLSWREGASGSDGPGGRVLRSGQPVIVRDVEEDPGFSHLAPALEFGFRSVIALPLRVDGRTFGGFFLYSPKVSDITDTELKLLQELADELAFGIANIRSQTERSKLQSIVVKVAGAVSAASGAEFFEQLARNMGEALEAQASFVARLLPGEPATARTIAGMINGQPAAPLEFLIAESPCADQTDDCCVADGVMNRFPKVSEFAAIGARGFVARWLSNSEGEKSGLIFVFFREPLEETEFINSTLRIFAARAASELQRQEAETQLREQAALLDAAHEAIYLKDLDDGVLYWNKGAERLYGWTRKEILHTRISDRLYVHPEKLVEAREKALAEGIWEGEVEKRTKDGRTLIVEVSWTLLRDEAGAPKSILAINSDITERKQLEQQFLRAQRMESIGTLAGGIAHDLNNALSPVIMSLELLKLKLTDPASQEMLAIISSSAQRGADMVRQVLSFARGVEGRRMEVQVKHLLQDIEKIARDTFLKSVRLRSIIPHNLWTVQGDPTQLHQVLLNLCVNARDAMPDGGELTISAENRVLDEQYSGLQVESQPGPYVFLQIEDTGTGMPPAVVEKIFDPFFTTKELGKGTGLGLSTSLAIVKSHGGFIQVYSELGKGTKFKVYLPAQTESSGEAIVEAAVAMPRGHGELILVVDDEDSVRRITQQTLEAFGYRVILAFDGAEAVATYAQRGEEISAVLTDMMMPIMDGPAAIRVLRSMNPAVKIIAASGLSANDHVAQVASLGVKHFLPKPYDAETLLRALSEILSTAA